MKNTELKTLRLRNSKKTGLTLMNFPGMPVRKHSDENSAEYRK